MHAAVAVEEAFVEDASGTIIDDATGTLACDRAAATLRFCEVAFGLVGRDLAGGLDALLDLERDGMEVVWMGGGLMPGGEDGSGGWVRRGSVHDSVGGSLRAALFFFFPIFDATFPFFHGWVGFALPRVAMVSCLLSSEGGFVAFICSCSAAAASFASSSARHPLLRRSRRGRCVAGLMTTCLGMMVAFGRRPKTAQRGEGLPLRRH